MSNSLKNSTILINQTRRLSSPSPSKKRKLSKRKIRKRKFSSGARKSKQKVLKRGRNLFASDTASFPLMLQQLTPLVGQTKDPNFQMHTQKIKVDRNELTEAHSKMREFQMIIKNLKSENKKLKSQISSLEKQLDNTMFEKFKYLEGSIEMGTINYEESKKLVNRINEIAQEYRKNTEEVESFDDLIDAQEWLIETWMTAAREFKRNLKKQLDKLNDE